MAHHTTVTIETEADRNVLLSAVWDALFDLLSSEDDPLPDDAYRAASLELGLPDDLETSELLGDLDTRIQRLTDLREDLSALYWTANEGDHVQLHFGDEEIAERLGVARARVEEYPGSDYIPGTFWQMAPEARERILANRDAAVRLQQQFAPETEAVA